MGSEMCIRDSRSLALKFELNAGGYASTPEIAPEEVVSTPEEQVSTPEETIQRRRKCSSPLALKLEFQRHRGRFQRLRSSTPQASTFNAGGNQIVDICTKNNANHKAIYANLNTIPSKGQSRIPQSSHFNAGVQRRRMKFQRRRISTPGDSTPQELRKGLR